MALFSSTPASFQQVSRFTPQQTQGLNQILQQALGGIGQGFDFQPIADQARAQFKEQTIPTIAERFTGLGAQRSSAFQEALGGAGAGLERDLAAQQGQFGLQRQNQFMNLLQMGLQPQFDTTYQPEQPSDFMQFLLPALLGGIGRIGGSLLGGL